MPPGVQSVHFFNEVDEGLWFYLDGLDLVPVPGTHPQYSTAYDLAEAYRGRRDPTDTIDVLDVRRETLEKQALLRWLDRQDTPAPFLLMRTNLYDRYARELAGRSDPGPPRVRPGPQGAGPAPRPPPAARRRVRSAHAQMTPDARRSAPRWTPPDALPHTPFRPLPDARSLTMTETPRCRVVGLRRFCRRRSLCKIPVLPDRDDRHDYSP